jgi:SnoaL-like domain
LSRLDEICDWIAICNAKARYCRTLDTKDWDGFRDMFTEDYELDVSDSGGPPVIKGRAAAMASVQASILTAKTAHQVHTPEIILNGDEATAVFAMQDRVVWSPDKSLTGYGHYHERWVRQNGEWKIAALRLTRLHMDVQFPPPAA